MHRAGFTNAVAPQGTAFTDEQARILKRYTDRLHLAFDADSAGVKAMARAAELALPIGFEIKVISFPGGKDPDELYNASGVAPVEAAVNSARDVLDFLFDSLSSESDLSNAAAKGRLATELVKYVSLVSNSVARSSYASHIAARLHIPETAVFQELNKLKNSSRTIFTQDKQSSSVTSLGNNSPSMPAADEKINAAEGLLLSLGLAHGTIAKRLEEELPSDMISQTSVGKALELLVQASSNGEWSEAAASIHNDPELGSAPEITRILVQAPPEYSPEAQEKMFSDCIRTIKGRFLEQESLRLQNALHGEQDAERKHQLLVESDACRKKLLALRKQGRF